MILAILQHTPTWVFILFAVLFWLGLRQTRDNTVSQYRTAIMPVFMLGLSFSGVAGAFPTLPQTYVAWFAGVAASVLVYRMVGVRSAASYDPQQGTFHLPGSWLPLCLMLTIFSTKYVMAIFLAMHPALHSQALFATGLSLIYGLLSGLFLARAANLWLLAWQTRKTASLAA
ncbi:DUF6622 family protein [Chitinimonas sp.]|uniref:DUF6622 family protein n=1 Tax=Chitinimonas sp. TaxID=1934313 RepID=UPI002F92A959